MVKQLPAMSNFLSQSKIITITSVIVEDQLKLSEGQNLARSCYVSDIPDVKSRYEVLLQGTVDGIEESNEENEEMDSDKLSLPTGVKLPKRDSDWQIANEYFNTMVGPETLKNENINTYVSLQLQGTILSYFKEQYSNVGDTHSHELYQRYGSVTKWKLKKNLRSLRKSYEINQTISC